MVSVLKARRPGVCPRVHYSCGACAQWSLRLSPVCSCVPAGEVGTWGETEVSPEGSAGATWKQVWASGWPSGRHGHLSQAWLWGWGMCAAVGEGCLGSSRSTGRGFMGSCGAARVRVGCHSAGSQGHEAETEIRPLGFIGKLGLTAEEARRDWASAETRSPVLVVEPRPELRPQGELAAAGRCLGPEGVDRELPPSVRSTR